MKTIVRQDRLKYPTGFKYDNIFGQKCIVVHGDEICQEKKQIDQITGNKCILVYRHFLTPETKQEILDQHPGSNTVCSYREYMDQRCLHLLLEYMTFAFNSISR